MIDFQDRVSIEDELRTLLPGTRLGLLSARVEVRDHDPELWRALEERAVELARLVAETPLAELPEIAAVRRAYKALGKDPSRYRGSPEALLRRIAQGKGLAPVNTVVDAMNLASLATLHPFGLYDARFVAPPVVLRAGRAGERYVGIAKGEINLEGLPVLADTEGPFGNPSSDSARAMVRADTTEVLLVVFAFPGSAEPVLDFAAHTLTRFARASEVRIGKGR